MPLAIVCLAVGELYGRGDHYVRHLLVMLERHCPVPFDLYCYSDRARELPSRVRTRDCSAWTELRRNGMRPTTLKLGLFNPDYAEFDEFLYLDLSLVVRDDMGPLLAYAARRPEPLVIVSDWHYDGYNSSVMRIRRGAMRFIHERFAAGDVVPQRIPGDQDFIHGIVARTGSTGRVATFPANQIISFKQTLRLSRRDPAAARRQLAAASIVKFHGEPRLHQACSARFRLDLRVHDLLHGRLRSSMPMHELLQTWREAGR